MPLYEFECSSCLRRHELLLSLGDRDGFYKCSDCQSELNVLISAPKGFVVGSEFGVSGQFKSRFSRDDE